MIPASAPLPNHAVDQLRTPAMPSEEEDHGDQVLVLRGLRALTVHKGITIWAIGESGMASASVSVPPFTTLRKSYRC